MRRHRAEEIHLRRAPAATTSVIRSTHCLTTGDSGPYQGRRVRMVGRWMRCRDRQYRWSRGHERLRRPGALLGLLALLFQLSIPHLHDLAVAGIETRIPSRQGFSQEPGDSGIDAPRLAAATIPRHGHDPADCPICQNLLHARCFLAARAPSLAAAPVPGLREGEHTAGPAHAARDRVAKPRAPPRSV
jgi:hypothetical protein